MSAHAVSPGMPRLFRNYETGWNQDYDCTIWQAVRATTTSPLLFKPIKIGPRGLEEPFIDGSFGCNNPLDILLEEAWKVFPERHVASIVSLGAGQLSPTSSLTLDVVDFLAEVASDCEEIANEAELQLTEVPGVYFRFNVSRSLESESGDWDQVAVVKAQTASYMSTEEISQRMVGAVEAMASRDKGKISTHKLRAYYVAITWSSLP